MQETRPAAPEGAATPTRPSPTPVAEAGRRRVAALDGLRGLALVGVLAYHAAPAAFPGGFLGVESFFVLSGYLLTSLLLDEHRRSGTISVRSYAVRRLRRIGPGLVALVGALLVLGPVVAPEDAHRIAGDVLSSLTGLTNWHLIADGSSYFGRAGRPSLLRHLWSVAVEIQFYVLCPFLVAWLARAPWRVAVGRLAGGMAASALVMTVLFRGSDPSRAYYGTDARVGALLAGVLLALVLARPASSARTRAWRLPPALSRVAGPAALGALGLLYFLAGDRARLSYPLAFLAIQAATAVLITAAVSARSPAGLLAWEPLRWLGVRSFGIYLWHWPAVVLLRPGIDVGWPPAVAATVAIGLGIFLGTLSYGLVERPFLRSPRAADARGRRHLVAPLAAAVALLVGAGLLARLPTADPIADTVREGQQVLAAQSRTTVPSATTTTTTSVASTTTTSPTTTTTAAPAAGEPAPGSPPPVPPPAPAPPDTVPPPPAPPPEPVPAMPVTAIGDSVMISAATALQGRLPPSSAIDAQANRQFRQAVEVVRRLRAEQRLASVVVVHLGNNGRVRISEVEELMAELADGRRVLFVNVRVDAPWRDSVNQVLSEAAQRFPMVTLVDWYGRSEGHRNWFQSDGTHFTATAGEGARTYAELITAAAAAP